MKIILLLNQPYPNGYALTKRFHLYAKGIIKNGHNAKFIIPIPNEKTGQSKNNLTRGYYEEIPYEYSWKNCERSKYFIIRRIHDLYGYLNTGIKIIKEKPTIIITSSFPFLFYCYIKLISIFISFKLIKEKCEVDYMTQESITSLDKFRVSIINKLFDAFIVINNQLKKFQFEDLRLNIPCIVVPILIDESIIENKLKIRKSIVYTGTFLERKDGILTILKAFSYFKVKFPDYKLFLTGSPQSSPDYKNIIDLIKQLKIIDSVIFTGYLSEIELREIIFSAELLIIAKPANRQNYYNFPTKIGEYLISGRPILSTKVGVVGELLSDGENIFFTENDPESMSWKMKFIVTNKQLASKIGKNGESFAKLNFNYIHHSERMIEFFKDINSKIY